MTDIVQQLRQRDGDWLCERAADEIERLRARNEFLRDVIRRMDQDIEDGTAVAVGGEPGASAGKSE